MTDTEERHYVAAWMEETEPVGELNLTKVTMRYSDEIAGFTMGSGNFSLKAGETLFMMGGNRSGKTRLLKVLCGLHSPDEGIAQFNSDAVDQPSIGRLRNLFSAVFSDFHLFNKLYWLTEDRPAAGKDSRKQVEMSEKTVVKDGRFTKRDLSTGRRKRLAQVKLMMEDRPTATFDEFAADQGPERRVKFYRPLLPELNALGKTVIAIAHDDAYQDRCDNPVKIDKGTIIETATPGLDGQLRPIFGSSKTCIS